MHRRGLTTLKKMAGREAMRCSFFLKTKYINLVPRAQNEVDNIFV